MKPDIASFWTGSPLSFFEQLCLKSFASLGHRTILYSYEDDLNVPAGVELLDAGTIMPHPRAMKYQTGFAPFADIFRINMIHKTGAVWVDCDVAAVRPMPDRPYIVARAGRWVGNAVLRLPQESPALTLLRDMLNAEELVLPADFPQRHLLPEALRNRTPPGEPFRVSAEERLQLPYMTFGPVALSYAMGKTGEVSQLMETNLFYPYNPFSLRANYFRARRALDDLPEETVAIHHIGGKPFRNAFQMKGQFIPPHPASLIGRLCSQHGIDPMAAPVIPKGVGESEARGEADAHEETGTEP
jgi:hypothetical protein